MKIQIIFIGTLYYEEIQTDVRGTCRLTLNENPPNAYVIHDAVSCLPNQATWIVLPLITPKFTYKLWVFYGLLSNSNKHVKSKEPIFIFFR